MAGESSKDIGGDKSRAGRRRLGDGDEGLLGDALGVCSSDSVARVMASEETAVEETDSNTPCPFEIGGWTCDEAGGTGVAPVT